MLNLLFEIFILVSMIALQLYFGFIKNKYLMYLVPTIYAISSIASLKSGYIPLSKTYLITPTLVQFALFGLWFRGSLLRDRQEKRLAEQEEKEEKNH